MIPILNDTTRRFTTRDNLGITGATTSLQAVLCPVINTVTPRAFYWPFMVWNYYEYIEATKEQRRQRDVNDFDKNFLKRNDYFFVLGNLLTNQDQMNLVGKDNTADDIRPDRTVYDYNEKYFVSRYGGMQYYNAGCDTLYYITSVDNDNVRQKFPLLNENLGLPLALAFVEAVKDTDYYQYYRRQGNQVPVEALKQWGERVNLTMNHLGECKELLKKSLFEPVSNPRLHNANLIASSNLMRFLYRGNHNPSVEQVRELLYQHYYQMRIEHSFPDNLCEISISWETVVARQYMALALEIMWKSLLKKLVTPITMSYWIDNTIRDSKFLSIRLNDRIEDIVNNYNYTSAEIEKLLKSGSGASGKTETLFESAIIVLLSIYNRFKGREDINPEYLAYGEDVSITNLLLEIDSHMNNSVNDLLRFFAENWILKRHLDVARNKMYYGRDAFYFYMDQELCFCKKSDANPDFPGLRLMQLMQVMKDLDMFYE